MAKLARRAGSSPQPSVMSCQDRRSVAARRWLSERSGWASRRRPVPGCHGPPGRSVARQRGCVAVLRATYQDTTQTFAVTVASRCCGHAWRAPRRPGRPRRCASPVARRRGCGPCRSGTRRRLTSLPGPQGRLEPPLRPYLVLATVGYADGRPWLSQGHDTCPRPR
jgi:hypothetical protein